MLLFAGLYLVFSKESIEKGDSIFKQLLPARYMLLLMGCFAFYIGWIYNDFLSIPFAVFGGSCYEVNDNEWERINESCTYPFGIDPVWAVSGNSLAFINSLKMKVFH